MPTPTKTEWRARILAERLAAGTDERRSENQALAVSAASLTTGAAGRTVCAYVPVGSEPGSMELLDALRGAGARVLLPVTRENSPLSWAVFTGLDDLVPAAYGLCEPSGPVLDPAEVRTAQVVLVPALAVDERGVRLGRGAGFYDRTLGLADPAAALIAIVRDAELVPALPEDPHDIRMGWALTPGRGLVPLGAGPRM